jgi:hypothetical protein
VNIYPLDQMVTVQQWNYTLQEWCDDYTGGCYEWYYWYLEDPQTFTSEDMDQAFENNNGFLSSFYQQQYYE